MDRNPPRSRNRDDDAGEPPAAIHGRIIRASKLKLLGMWVLAVVFFVACGYMLLERWVLPEANRVLPFRLTWWGSLLSVIGFLIALIGIVALLFEFLCLKQLVLGDEAFQVVRRWVSGTTVVEVHIPYSNIKAVVYEKRGEDWQLGIDLHDPDEDTYAKDENDLQKKDRRGHDYILDGGYRLSLQEVARLLEKKRRKAERKPEPEGRTTRRSRDG